MLQSNSMSNLAPLSGVVVVSIEQALAAPLCTSRLSDMGARVIKIERVEGDFARGYDDAANGASSYFVWTNHGKESITLDIKKSEDATLLENILGAADVFIQNLAPGAMARAGFGSADLRRRHPTLITCDITGYGIEGEVSGLKAYDLLVQCESGLAGLTGSADACGRVGVSICDIGAGLNAVIGVLSALAARERTGQGAGITVSLFDSAADWMTIPYLHEMYGNGAPTRQGLQHPSIAPYGAYLCGDGSSIVISIQNEREWCQFCEIFLRQPALPADPRYASNTSRVRHRESLNQIIGDVFAQLSTEQALARLSEANTAYGRVNSVADLTRHPALRTWPMQVGDRQLQIIAPPVRTPWDRFRFEAAPDIGQQSAAIRAEFRSCEKEVAA